MCFRWAVSPFSWLQLPLLTFYFHPESSSHLRKLSGQSFCRSEIYCPIIWKMRLSFLFCSFHSSVVSTHRVAVAKNEKYSAEATHHCYFFCSPSLLLHLNLYLLFWIMNFLKRKICFSSCLTLTSAMITSFSNNMIYWIMMILKEGKCLITFGNKRKNERRKQKNRSKLFGWWLFNDLLLVFLLEWIISCNVVVVEKEWITYLMFPPD